MRLLTNETPAEARARIDRQRLAQERQREDALLRRIASTAAGRLRLAEAIDEGREASRAARREAFPLVA